MPQAGSPSVRAWEDFYRSSDVVARYARQSRLQPPERAIFDVVGAETLARGRFLDVGVGGGRTTHELAWRCRHYVGVDYVEPMVAACRARFADLCRRHDVRFQVADARALPFDDGAFDVVFFSFNGIDLVGAEDRDRTLAECRRVLVPGGWFIYSSHNLAWLDNRAGIRWSGLRDGVETHLFWSRMRRLNRAGGPYRARPWAELIDPHNGGSTCYVRPSELLRQTRAAGFDPVRVFDLAGEEVTDASRQVALQDAWVYLLCRNGEAAAASR
jgi:SAM-dependent methyltransferase